MTAPSFLNTDAQYTHLTGVTDVNTVMTALATLLTSTLSSTPTGVFTVTQQWSNPSGTTYQSPVDARGRYMTVALTRTTATRLRFTISDPTGTLIDGEIQIAAGGSTVDLYAGPGHLYVESNNAGTWEPARAIISDPTPEALDSGPSYVWAGTYRDTSGNLVSSGANMSFWGGRYAGGSQIGLTTLQNLGSRPLMGAQDTGNTKLLTEAGSDVAAPLGISNATSSALINSAAYYAGKLYQVICVNSDQSAGAVLAVPIDTGITGNFRVLNITGVGPVKMAIQIPL
jgi:hypothetical protein